MITFNSDDKEYYDPSKYSSNDFSSAKLCAAWVGDSRTPSFLPSVNITSPNSPQSLLPSRNEFFKDIQDVGEDNSLYLHLTSSLGIWTFLLHLTIPPWRICGMKRNSQKR
ncbi:hypothetical protein O181_010160 [Austropuccinia psidii MF-1]|uniref:Uncharacterized protein n=1 Tax=Austropuccinia psidii MF-1 TaxID=1389203 RepID=A0A9Q3BTC2_9BASI|nr:hypothetical protein [Austropuccinia psidii MF-1]